MPRRGQRTDKILEREVKRNSPQYGEWEQGNPKTRLFPGSDTVGYLEGGKLKEEQGTSWKKEGAQKTPGETPL